MTMHHVYVYSLGIPTSLSIASWNLRGREIVVAFEANQAFCARPIRCTIALAELEGSCRALTVDVGVRIDQFEKGMWS